MITISYILPVGKSCYSRHVPSTEYHKYSSAKFYESGVDEFRFLKHWISKVNYLTASN